MIVVRVLGHVVSTIKEKSFEAYKLLVVRPVDLEGQYTGDSFLALDRCQAGVGDHVLILEEGNGIRSLMDMPRGAADALAVGVIDYVEKRGVQRNLPGPEPGLEGIELTGVGPEEGKR